MAGRKSDTVHVNWYATGFRGDGFQDALLEIAPVALRYGATEWQVFRALDDLYKFQQIAHFENKLDWERYWLGEEFNAWRADYSGWYQVPLVYQPNVLVGRGSLGSEHADPGFERQRS